MADKFNIQLSQGSRSVLDPFAGVQKKPGIDYNQFITTLEETQTKAEKQLREEAVIAQTAKGRIAQQKEIEAAQEEGRDPELIRRKTNFFNQEFARAHNLASQSILKTEYQNQLTSLDARLATKPELQENPDLRARVFEQESQEILKSVQALGDEEFAGKMFAVKQDLKEKAVADASNRFKAREVERISSDNKDQFIQFFVKEGGVYDQLLQLGPNATPAQRDALFFKFREDAAELANIKKGEVTGVPDDWYNSQLYALSDRGAEVLGRSILNHLDVIDSLSESQVRNLMRSRAHFETQIESGAYLYYEPARMREWWNEEDGASQAKIRHTAEQVDDALREGVNVNVDPITVRNIAIVNEGGSPTPDKGEIQKGISRLVAIGLQQQVRESTIPHLRRLRDEGDETFSVSMERFKDGSWHATLKAAVEQDENFYIGRVLVATADDLKNPQNPWRLALDLARKEGFYTETKDPKVSKGLNTKFIIDKDMMDWTNQLIDQRVNAFRAYDANPADYAADPNNPGGSETFRLDPLSSSVRDDTIRNRQKYESVSGSPSRRVLSDDYISDSDKILFDANRTPLEHQQVRQNLMEHASASGVKSVDLRRQIFQKSRLPGGYIAVQMEKEYGTVGKMPTDLVEFLNTVEVRGKRGSEADAEAFNTFFDPYIESDAGIALRNSLYAWFGFNRNSAPPGVSKRVDDYIKSLAAESYRKAPMNSDDPEYHLRNLSNYLTTVVAKPINQGGKFIDEEYDDLKDQEYRVVPLPPSTVEQSSHYDATGAGVYEGILENYLTTDDNIDLNSRRYKMLRNQVFAKHGDPDKAARRVIRTLALPDTYIRVYDDPNTGDRVYYPWNNRLLPMDAVYLRVHGESFTSYREKAR